VNTAYEAALAAHNAALDTYRIALAAYRAGGPNADFAAALAVKQLADIAFDKAFAIAAEGPAARNFLNTTNGTLDRFVQRYCEAAFIRLDGDVFGIMFSGKEDYTTREAATLIEDGADAYRLHIHNLEFPDFDYDLPKIEGFEDTSWKNDVCPSLTRRAADESQTLILWCDYADPAQREIGGKRYTLIKGEYGETDNQVTLCESDDIADILAAIATHDR
jgi:hypothetical protein